MRMFSFFLVLLFCMCSYITAPSPEDNPLLYFNLKASREARDNFVQIFTPASEPGLQALFDYDPKAENSTKTDADVREKLRNVAFISNLSPATMKALRAAKFPENITRARDFNDTAVRDSLKKYLAHQQPKLVEETRPFRPTATAPRPRAAAEPIPAPAPAPTPILARTQSVRPVAARNARAVPAARDDSADQTAELARLREESRKALAEKETLVAEKIGLKTLTAAMEESNENLTSAIAVNNKKIKELTEALRQAHTALEEQAKIGDIADGLLSQNNAATAELKSKEAALAAAQAERAQLTQRLEEMDALRTTLSESQAKQTSLRAQLAAAQAQMTAIGGSNASLTAQIADLSKQLTAAQAEAESLQAQSTAAIASHKAQTAALKSEHEAALTAAQERAKKATEKMVTRHIETKNKLTLAKTFHAWHAATLQSKNRKAVEQAGMAAEELAARSLNQALQITALQSKHEAALAPAGPAAVAEDLARRQAALPQITLATNQALATIAPAERSDAALQARDAAATTAPSPAPAVPLPATPPAAQLPALTATANVASISILPKPIVRDASTQATSQAGGVAQTENFEAPAAASTPAPHAAAPATIPSPAAAPAAAAHPTAATEKTTAKSAVKGRYVPPRIRSSVRPTYIITSSEPVRRGPLKKRSQVSVTTPLPTPDAPPAAAPLAAHVPAPAASTPAPTAKAAPTKHTQLGTLFVNTLKKNQRPENASLGKSFTSKVTAAHTPQR